MCLPVCCRSIAQGLEKKKENVVKKDQGIQNKTFSHSYASESGEGEKEILLENMPFDFD